jgi:hypothetical protein
MRIHDTHTWARMTHACMQIMPWGLHTKKGDNDIFKHFMEDNRMDRGMGGIDWDALQVHFDLFYTCPCALILGVMRQKHM